MKVYVFGNPDVESDSAAVKAAKYLKNKVPEVKFEFTTPNSDLIFDNTRPVILDTIQGIKKITIVKNPDHLILPPRNSVHDFDLGFQLRYLKKMGMIKDALIIGVPTGKKINYFRIQSILRKLVAQDMQGS
jgi:hypothetical protein